MTVQFWVVTMFFGSNADLTAIVTDKRLAEQVSQ